MFKVTLIRISSRHGIFSHFVFEYISTSVQDQTRPNSPFSRNSHPIPRAYLTTFQISPSLHSFNNYSFQINIPSSYSSPLLITFYIYKSCYPTSVALPSPFLLHSMKQGKGRCPDEWGENPEDNECEEELER